MNEREAPKEYQFADHPEAKEFLRHLEWEMPNRVAEIEKYETEFTAVALAFGWDENTVQDLALGFREAVINAIRHGNLGLVQKENQLKEDYEEEGLQAERSPDAQKTKVHVTVDVSADRIQIVIQDHGGARTRQSAEKFLKHDPADETHLRENHGRGGRMMQLYFGNEGVRPLTNEEGMRLILTKNRNPKKTATEND